MIWIFNCLGLLVHSGVQVQFDTASYPKPYSEINYLYRITAILNGMVFCQEADDMEVCMRELIKEISDQTETPEDLKLNLKIRFLNNQLQPVL
mgnify:FL=1